MTAKAGRGSDQFVLRLPDGMRDRIKAAAQLNNRSMNAEIVATLELRFPEPGSFEELATELNDLATSMLLEEDQRKREKLAERHLEVLEEMRILQSANEPPEE